jgi:hypothetical protein
MLKNRLMKFFLAFLCVANGSLLTPMYGISAGMDGTHNHHGQGMRHEHVMGEEVSAELKTEPATLTAGSPATIMIALKNLKGKPVAGLTVHHDRLVHVVIASQEFSVFSHIHPEDFGPITPQMRKTSVYPVRFTFPKAGRYIIGIDFAVKEQLFSRHFIVDVGGEPAMAQLKKDLAREKKFGDMDVTFSLDQQHVTAGKEVILMYRFSKNNKPVSDLEPYLSAPMHLAIISADLDRFIHTHGEIPGMPAMEHHDHKMPMDIPRELGPEIDVHVVFPAKGLYQIFGQVGYQGKVIATSFMVEVE